MAELLFKEEVYAIVGAALEVYNELGTGFYEGVFQEALEIELELRQIRFEAQKELVVHYKAVNSRRNMSLISFATKRSSSKSKRWIA